MHEAVAQELYPHLDAATEPPAALRAIRADGALGVKGGRGVLGAYDPEEARAITERRDRTLVALQRLRGRAD